MATNEDIFGQPFDRVTSWSNSFSNREGELLEWEEIGVARDWSGKRSEWLEIGVVRD